MKKSVRCISSILILTELCYSRPLHWTGKDLGHHVWFLLPLATTSSHAFQKLIRKFHFLSPSRLLVKTAGPASHLQSVIKYQECHKFKLSLLRELQKNVNAVTDYVSWAFLKLSKIL